MLKFSASSPNSYLKNFFVINQCRLQNSFFSSDVDVVCETVCVINLNKLMINGHVVVYYFAVDYAARRHNFEINVESYLLFLPMLMPNLLKNASIVLNLICGAKSKEILTTEFGLTRPIYELKWLSTN